MRWVWAWAISLVLCAACSSGQRAICAEIFYEIPIGISVEEMIDCLGRPYSICDKGNGQLEYEYIERLEVGARTLGQTHYIFLVENGRVVSRRVEQKNVSPLRFNSYEMQTTERIKEPIERTAPSPEGEGF